MLTYPQTAVLLLIFGRDAGLLAAFTEEAFGWTHWTRWLPILVVSYYLAAAEFAWFEFLENYLTRGIYKPEVIERVEAASTAAFILQLFITPLAGLVGIALCAHPRFEGSSGIKILVFLGSLAVGVAIGIIIVVIFVFVRYLTWEILDRVKHSRMKK